MNSKKSYFIPHYSTRFIEAYRNYLARHHSEQLFKEVCDEMAVPENYLTKKTNWVSNDFLNDFVNLLKRKTGIEDIAYYVGKSFLSPANINPFEYALFKVIPAYFYFLAIGQNVKKGNRFSEYRLTKIRPGHVLFELVTPQGIHSVDVCKNAVGVFEAFEDAMGLDKVRVVHTRCLHRGDHKCEFEINYSAKKIWLQRGLVVGSIGVICAGLYEVGSWLRPGDSLFMGSLVFSGLVFSSMVVVLAKFFSIIKYNLIHTELDVEKENVINQKKHQLNFKHHETQLLNELAITLNRGLSSDEILEHCLNELKTRFGYRAGIVMLLNEAEKRIRTHRMVGFEAEEARNALFSFSVKYPSDNPSESELFANILDQGKPRLVGSINQFKEKLAHESNRALISLLGVNSLIVAPISDEQQKFGLLVVGRFGGDEVLTKEDRELIEKVTQLLTLAFKNAYKLENERKLKELFKKYVPAIVLDGIDSEKMEVFAPQQMHIASIFVDLRDFTTYSENIPPHRLRQMLGMYISYVNKTLSQYGGFIDKIAGDGVNAFFLKTETHLNPARSALMAGWKLLKGAPALREEFKKQGFPEPRFGVGIHCGSAIVGSFGSEHKLEYAALGDTVNTASRLQSLAKDISIERGFSEYSVVVASKKVLEESMSKVAVPNFTVSRALRGKASELEVAVFVESADEKRSLPIQNAG